MSTCYQFLIDVSQGNVLELGRLHYNIAEAALIAKDPENAIKNYRWIVDNLSIKVADQKDLAIQASVKSLDVRYQMIQDKGWRPAELAAKNIDSSPKDLPQPVKEWISWVDQFPASDVGSKTIFDQKYDAILFESNRILYSFDHVSQAVDRLQAFVEKYPTSKSAMPSAALVIDTYVTSKKWTEAYTTAMKFATVNAWKGTDFSKRLALVIGDSYYSILNTSYMAKDYAGTLKNADDFLHKNPGNRRQTDFLELAANASLGMGDKVRASGYFKQLAQMPGEKKEVAALGQMTDGSIAEDHFDFAAASDSYRRLVESGAPQGQTPDMRRKILLFAWLSADPGRLNSALSNHAICPSATDAVCKEYKSRDGQTSSVAVALNRLKTQKRLSFKTRVDLMKQVASEWAHQSSIDQQVLVAEVVDEMPELLHGLRLDVRKSAQVTFDQWSIQHRMKLMNHLESVSESLVALPMTRVQIAAQLEVAGSYQDMVQDLHAIKKPKGLSDQDAKDVEAAIANAAAPFVKKREDLKVAALKHVQETGADAKTLDLIFTTFKDDASLADNRTGKESTEQSSAFETGLLAGLSVPATDSGKAFFAVFQARLQQSNCPQTGFLIQMATEQKLAGESDLSLMRAMLLAKSGLIAEAAGELRSHLTTLDSKAKEKAIAAIWTAYSVLGATEVVAKDIDSTGKLISLAQRALPTRVPAEAASPTPSSAPSNAPPRAPIKDQKKGAR